ncbi:MAG TPA: hypothetical protein VFH58_08815 [Acidimicrobiales bacterium]|nr:hypothetical protein [Acidimicrobiales bacterium]
MDSGARHEALQRIHGVAAGQHQLVLLSDLTGAGLTRALIEGLVASGWLRRQHKGMYLVGPREPSAWQRTVAAWMAAGARAVVSHSSAAEVHRLPHLVGGGVPEVTVTGSRQPRPRGVRVHRVQVLAATDVERRQGVPITAPARTLIDLAPRLSPALLSRAIDEGAIQRLWTPESLLSARRRAGRRPGSADLDRLLAMRVEGPQSDSHLENRVERALRCLGPFESQYQLVIDGRVLVVDLALPALKLVVESDGWGTRGRSRGKFDGDRRKSNLLVANGWTVVHLTSAMSDDEMRGAVVAAMLQLAARGSQSSLQT